MWMTDYIREVKRQFRDVYKFKPVEIRGGEIIFGEDQISDGSYPMEIEGKVDHVETRHGKISCCNHESEFHELENGDLFRSRDGSLWRKEGSTSQVQNYGTALQVSSPSAHAILFHDQDKVFRVKEYFDRIRDEEIDSLFKTAAMRSLRISSDHFLRIATSAANDIANRYSMAIDAWRWLPIVGNIELTEIQAVALGYDAFWLHSRWVRAQERDGWEYGEFVDICTKKHPCIVGYEQLDIQLRHKVELFVSTVSKLWNYYTSDVAGNNAASVSGPATPSTEIPADA